MSSSPGQRAKVGSSSSLGTAGELTFFIAGTADELCLLRHRDSKLVRSPSSVLTQAGAGSVKGLTTPPVFWCCSARGKGGGGAQRVGGFSRLLPNLFVSLTSLLPQPRVQRRRGEGAGVGN